MKGHEIRQKFIEYFERNGHKVVHSSPLLPANDPTLLFTNAGMNQFKDVFLGNEKREYTRAVSSQKCIRAGGKHNDLDEVGKTARHHTFFEMLGNFSFGDYFKEDAIRYAWDFLVNDLMLEPQRLWFSYFGGDEEVGADEEARGLWIKMGAKPERVLPFGRKDNFWQMGDTGPCGPCSEIHYYMGDQPANPDENHPKWVNGEGDTTMEIWNLVFMQYNRIEESPGKFRLENLPAPSVDTGAGLERLSAVLQGVKTNYDTDLLMPIVEFAAGSAAGKYSGFDDTKKFACRVIADHARSTAFAIADGILPGNEGRNYVLRKIMRRAIYHGREHLGFNEPFFYKVCDKVVEEMKGAFPELEAQRGFIEKMVKLEEERFGRTLTAGAERFRVQLDELLHTSQKAREILESTYRETESIENAYKASNEYESKIKEKYPNNPLYEFIKMVVENRIPPSLLKEEIKSVSKGNEERNDSLGYLLKLSKKEPPSSDVEGLDIVGQFDLRLAREIISYIEKYGSKKDKDFIDRFIFRTFGGNHQSPPKVPINIFNEIILDTEQTREFSHELDLRFIDFANFASIYDTCGYPSDLIRVGLEGQGLYFRENEFDDRFKAAIAELQQSSEIGKTERKSVISPVYAQIAEKTAANAFLGYETIASEGATVAAILKEEKEVDSLKEGEEGLIILNETPFYAESGGQIGDTGYLSNQDSSAKVFDTFSPVAGIILHKSKVEKGSIKVGDALTATVDAERRDAIRRNHTATHLVHAALREVLGTHVKQAGSVVAPNYLRFDFTHYQPMSAAEIREIEGLVNREILKNEAVNTDLMPIEDAMRSGAMALFGEKYGGEVRVLSVGSGEFSRELCGGTHVRATGDIGSFKITADEAIASGVRRIRAITGYDAFERFREDELLIERSLGALKTQRDQLPNAIEKLQEELKKTRKEIDELKLKIATGAMGSASSGGDEAREVAGIKALAKAVEGLDTSAMRNLSDTLLGQMKSGVVILGRAEEGKVGLIVRVSDDLTDKVKAGNIIREITPIVGGKGGGRPDMAEGGGSMPEKLGEAIEASYAIIEKMAG